MDFGKAAELMGMNAISPEALSESIGAEFSQEDLLSLKEIPFEEPELLASDPYQKIDKFGKLSSVLKLKDSYILFPMPDKIRAGNKVLPLNVFQIIQHFGFAQNQLKKIFFVNNSKSSGNYPPMPGWEKWFFNEKAVLDHPIYRTQKPEWIFMRKSLVPESSGKNFKNGSWWLKSGDQVPSLLEVLIGMIGFYFQIKNSKKSDKEIGMPFYEDRDLFARILSGSMTWTADQFFLKENSPPENLTVGLNMPGSGIDIEKLDSSKSSGILGILPLRRLKISSN